MARGPSHCQVLLGILSDGDPHTSSEILRAALDEVGGMIVHSRVAELRRRGYVIECVHLEGVAAGGGAYSYRLLAEPAAVTPEVRAAALRRPAPKASPEEGEVAGVSEFAASLAVEEGTASGLRSTSPSTASPFADLEYSRQKGPVVPAVAAGPADPVQLTLGEAA